MNPTRLRSAMLGILFPDPAVPLALAMRSLGADEAWACFEAGHRSIPAPLLDRWGRLDPQSLAAAARRSGARIIVPSDDEWPQQLDALGAARPWALWVRGESLPSNADSRSVAIVGARSCTGYGERVASEFGAELARAGVPVISGGAYGIDAAAHRGALAGEGPTVAVLACGVDVAYPPAHAALFERICATGSIVSEAPPGAHPTKPAFLVRNRLIAALSYGTVVVEARHRSGAFSTYAHARALDRVLMAVPGPIDSPESAGTNRVLQEDAQLVASAADVLGLIAPLDTLDFDVEAQERREWDELGPHERLIHEAMPARAALTIDALLARLPEPLPLAVVMSALAALAAREVVGEEPDGRWRRLRPLRGAAA